jgi:signal recognition particle subunit SRP54
VSDVNGLVNRFFEARKMMGALAGGKMPNIPGMPGMNGGGGPAARRPAAKQKKKGHKVSGNPAKRNAPQPAGTAAPAPLDEAALQKAMAEFELPPELRRRLGQ